MSDLPKGKPILVLDFDGVLHSYTSGWKGPRNIPDAPVPGAMEFLYRATKEFNVQIYSSRSRYFLGRHFMKIWLRTYLFDYAINKVRPVKDWSNYAYYDHEDLSRWVEELLAKLKFPLMKPAAFLQIDDRAICFNGTWPSIEDLKEFKPWFKRR
jgi:hypothetical protein